MAAEYRFYSFNRFDVIDRADRLRLADDAAATAHARGLPGPGRIEVWTGERRIAIVPPRRLNDADAA